jgi:hypothetical protein
MIVQLHQLKQKSPKEKPEMRGSWWKADQKSLQGKDKVLLWMYSLLKCSNIMRSAIFIEIWRSTYEQGLSTNYAYAAVET